MATEEMQISPQIKKFILFSIRFCYRYFCDYPLIFMLSFLLFIIYRIFPYLFSILLYYSPVFALTSLLLGALLTYGESNITQNKEIETKICENSTLKSDQCEKAEREDDSRSHGSSSSESESESDGAESSSPDASMAEIIPILDQLAPVMNPKSTSPAPVSTEKERFRRLESLIVRRRARMSLRHEIKRTLIESDGDYSLSVRVAPVLTPRPNPYDFSRDLQEQGEGFLPVPGSAPSVLLHGRSPFDPSFDPAWIDGVSRLDPYLATEMDSRERKSISNLSRLAESNTVSLVTDLNTDLTYNFRENSSDNDTNMDVSTEGSNDKNEAEKENFITDELITESEPAAQGELVIDSGKVGLNPNPATSLVDSDNITDTILLSEYLNFCSTEITPTVIDQNSMESPTEECETLTNPEPRTTETVDISCSEPRATETVDLLCSNHKENNPNYQVEENDRKSDTEMENGSSVEEINLILKQIREEAQMISVSKAKMSEIRQDVNCNGQIEEREKNVDPNVFESEMNDSVLEPEIVLKRSPLSNSIASNLKKLRKKHKQGDSSSSSSSSSSDSD